MENRVIVYSITLKRKQLTSQSYSQSQIDLFERDVLKHHYHLRHPLAYLQVRWNVLVHGSKIEDRFDSSLQILEKVVIAKFRHHPVNHLQQSEEIKVFGQILEHIRYHARVDLTKYLRDLPVILVVRQNQILL